MSAAPGAVEGPGLTRSWREVEAWRHVIGLALKRSLEEIVDPVSVETPTFWRCRMTTTDSRQLWGEAGLNLVEKLCVCCGW